MKKRNFGKRCKSTARLIIPAKPKPLNISTSITSRYEKNGMA